MQPSQEKPNTGISEDIPSVSASTFQMSTLFVKPISKRGRICEEEGWNCIATEDSSQLIAQEYDAIVFLSTTGDILNEGEQNHLKKFIEKGGGFVGIHAAANTQEEWNWFNENVLCAVFKRHDSVKPLVVDVVVRNHPSTTHLEETWPRVDEWYVYDRIPQNVTVLFIYNIIRDIL